METVGGAVKLMFFVYAVAIVIALATAWMIKLIFFVIQTRNSRAAKAHSAKSGSSAAPAKAHAKRTS